MSCNVGNIVACPQIQKDLNEEFNGLGSNIQEAVPFLEFLNSGTNTKYALQRQLDSKNGHIRAVELRYTPRGTTNEVTDSISATCSGGTVVGNDSKTYEIDPTVGSQIEWGAPLSELIEACEDDAAYFSRVLRNRMEVLERSINQKMWTTAATLFGKFPSTGTTAEINVQTKTNSGAGAAYVPQALQKVRHEYRLMEHNGGIALFGGSFDFSEYFDSMAGMCCNTTIGIDIAQLFATKGIAPFFDLYAETALGSNEFLAMAPGALQPLWYNKYRGEYRAINTDTEKAGIITSPRTGIEYDYYAKYNCEQWYFRLSVAHDLVALPEDIFCADDRLTGVNWVNHFKIVNPAP